MLQHPSPSVADFYSATLACNDSAIDTGQCLADLREVDIGSGTAARLRDFRCVSNSGGSTVRLQYLRLSDIVLDSVLAGDTPTRLRPIIGTPQIIETATLREFKDLMSEYGEVNSLPCLGVRVETPAAGAGFSDDWRCEYDEAAQKKYKTLGGWVDRTVIDFPSPSLLRRVSAGRSTWREMGAADLSDAARSLRSINSALRRMPRGRDVEISRSVAKDIHKRLRLEARLTEGKPPRDYQFILAHDPEGCDDGETVYLFIRPLVVEVLMIENMGNISIEVESLFGQSVDSGLRGTIYLTYRAC